MGSTSTLIDLLQDVEHVMLSFDGPVCNLYQGDSAVRDAEVAAAGSAGATRGVASALAAAKRSERTLAVVSENAQEAVAAYLGKIGLGQYFDLVTARVGADAGFVHPSASLLTRALSSYAALRGVGSEQIDLEQARKASVYVGSSFADVRAAAADGVVCIAYARSAGDARRFEDSDVAAAVITDMHQLADALNARWDEQWCSWQGCC